MSAKTIKSDVLIIGASASGLMCAIEAGKRGRKVTVLDHANKAGKKILMSGGGRCNFTNRNMSEDNFISHNPHFCKSAINRYTQWDFINLVDQHNIAYHERDAGKLFCDDSSKDILNMLLKECSAVNVDILLNSYITNVRNNSVFYVDTNDCTHKSKSLVIASGGLSIPKMCATPFGYKIAEQFNHHIWPTSAGLVPFTLHTKDKEKLSSLSGVSVDTVVSNQRIQFSGNILFTHRGLSGPAILQISSYWNPGESITINLLPELNLYDFLIEKQKSNPNTKLQSALGEMLPKRLLPTLIDQNVLTKPLQEISNKTYTELTKTLQNWVIQPNATEGYRTAEVTLGGVDCNELSSKTMESNKTKGLYFIGEVVDMTGWLGGYNFQWAWSSGWCAGQVV